MILMGTWMSEPNLIVINPIVDKPLHSEPVMSTSWWCLMKSLGINKVIRFHPLGTMNVWVLHSVQRRITKVIKSHPLVTVNVCTGFESTKYCICRDISVWTKVSTGPPYMQISRKSCKWFVSGQREGILWMTRQNHTLKMWESTITAVPLQQQPELGNHPQGAPSLWPAQVC